MTIREAIERLQQYVVGVVEKPPRTLCAKGVRAGLFCLSRVYRTLVQLRLLLYEHGIIRQRRLGCLVVSVGNLTVGGTGKTPVVEVFAKTLASKGRRVAILSRGYRSKSTPFWLQAKALLLNKRHEVPPRVVSDGRRLLMNSEMAGDEPYMLASNLKNVMVVVDKDRVKAGKHAIRDLGADTLLLDDGFQYLKLRPRLNICLVDATNPFDNHHLLPRGLLREPIRNLRRADYIFLTKSSGTHAIGHLKSFLQRHNRRAEIIECTHQAKYFEDVYSHQRLGLEIVRGRRVAAISGIAAPQSFENFLAKLGAGVVYSEQFIDHHRYRQQEVIDFVNAAMAHDAEMVLTTEKDAVRFPKLDRRDLPVYFLRVEIDILSGKESFDDCIARICFL